MVSPHNPSLFARKKITHTFSKCMLKKQVCKNLLHQLKRKREPTATFGHCRVWFSYAFPSFLYSSISPNRLTSAWILSTSNFCSLINIVCKVTVLFAVSMIARLSGTSIPFTFITALMLSYPHFL